jgi:dTDP-glucose pyrophosphorylase
LVAPGKPERKSRLRPANAIVLAAGKTPPALFPLFGRTSPAMIPVNGRPIIHWLVRYLHELEIAHVVVAIREEDDRLARLLSQCFREGPTCEQAPITEDRGPGFSLLYCLRRLKPEEPVLVVLGDTLFQMPKDEGGLFSSPFVLTAPVEDAARWCLAEVDATRTVRALSDKPAENPGRWPALVGVYYFDTAAAARDALEKLAKETTGALQLSDALKPYVKAGRLKARDVPEWLDCGNIDMLTSSRRRLLATRSFNQTQVDELRGTITKRSTHVRKFTDEINYFRLLPGELAIFFPRLVAFDLMPKNLSLTLEYYGYPTLSEMWVFESFETARWKMIFTTLREILRCFTAFPAELTAEEIFRFYWEKTRDRVAEFAAQDETFARWIEASDLTINGKPMRSWSALAAEVEREIRAIARTDTCRIVHGDLCFPNILFDPVSRLFKFIDPRGSFGAAGLFGDGRYDAAKLLHSINGGYDFLIHEMFAVRSTPKSIDLEQFFPPSRAGVLRHYEEAFAADYDLREVRLIEALLFISMCPLHADSKPRQAAMYATGLRLLHDYFS